MDESIIQLPQIATEETRRYLAGHSPLMCGVAITGMDRDMFSGKITVHFEPGWEITFDADSLYQWGGPDEVLRFLIDQVKVRLQGIDHCLLEAFAAPEVLQDENPDDEIDLEYVCCPYCGR